MIIALKCPSCGGGGENECLTQEDFVLQAYEDSIHWTDAIPAMASLDSISPLLASQNTPVQDEIRLVQVNHPFK